ncbi:hypothetical protein BDN72DRAFT_197174 [Pluteus cervinus]|uniref:Uncharacterized protein n=1 Tax=Pluteus cervinus TaxID=181527 RepID=A0ACD3AIM7_9AGAR|nr:hypothetical protein BDN72DRAFT_197174 [Pluteus cervinus]
MPMRYYPRQNHATRFKSTPNLRYASFDDQPEGNRLIPVLWEVERGQSFLVDYIGPVAYYIIEGQVTATEDGRTLLLQAGDVLVVEYGSVITLSSPSKGKSFGVAYTPSGNMVDDFLDEKETRGR